MLAAYGGHTMANPKTRAAIAAVRERERHRALSNRGSREAEAERLQREREALRAARAELEEARTVLRADLQAAAAKLAEMEALLGRSITPFEFARMPELAPDLPPAVAQHIATMRRDELQAAAETGFRPSLATIRARVCRATGVSLNAFMSTRRHRQISFARQMFYYWAARATTKSLPEIGRFCGGRDHTTILHGARIYPEKRAAMGRYLRPYGGRAK